MTESQYVATVDALIADMQQMREQEDLNAYAVGLNNDRSDDGFDDAVDGLCTSIAYQLSWRELA